MYAQGKVKHVDPPLVALEDQMCDFGLSGLSSGASPDRLDALVWAVTELISRGAWQVPRIRSLWDGPVGPEWMGFRGGRRFASRHHYPLVPAKAGTQGDNYHRCFLALDSRWSLPPRRRGRE
jgi:hypothetical protein